MGTYKTPSEGGSGGRRGHSGMEHWTHTEELKEAANLRRRQDDRRLSGEGRDESDIAESVVDSVEDIELLPDTTTAVFVRRIDDGKCAALAQKVPNLEIIHQDGSAASLTDAGVAKLAALANLRSLDLEWATTLTDASADHLRRLRNLRYLDITFSGLTPDATRDLRRALPNCEIAGPSE